MQISFNGFYLLMFSRQFYEKWVSVRKRTINLRLETATYIATTETVARNYNRNSHVHNALHKIPPA